MKKIIFSILLCIFMGTNIAATQEIDGQTNISDDSTPKIILDLANIDIRVFVSYASELLGKDIFVDPIVKKKVTIQSRINKNEFYNFFLSELKKHNLVAVEEDDTIVVTYE